LNGSNAMLDRLLGPDFEPPALHAAMT